jgi:predicted helicase
MNEERKKMFLLFCWFGNAKSFDYIPEWDQNHVVRGKKAIDWLIDFKVWKCFW